MASPEGVVKASVSPLLVSSSTRLGRSTRLPYGILHMVDDAMLLGVRRKNRSGGIGIC